MHASLNPSTKTHTYTPEFDCFWFQCCLIIDLLRMVLIPVRLFFGLPYVCPVRYEAVFTNHPLIVLCVHLSIILIRLTVVIPLNRTGDPPFHTLAKQQSVSSEQDQYAITSCLAIIIECLLTCYLFVQFLSLFVHPLTTEPMCHTGDCMYSFTFY